MRTITYFLFIPRSANSRNFPPNEIALFLSILRRLEGLLELFLALKPSGNLRRTTQTGNTNRYE